MRDRNPELEKLTYKTLLGNLLKDGCPDNYYNWAKSNIRSLLQSRTVYEKRVDGFLKSNRVRFIPQAPFYLRNIAKLCFIDFYVPKGKYIIEVDGGYHFSVEKRTTDLLQDAEFKELGYRVIRIKNNLTTKNDLYGSLFPIVGKKSVEKKIEDRVKAVEDRVAMEKRIEENHLKIENGEGRWSLLRNVLAVLESSPEKSDVLLRIKDKDVAKQVILAYQGKAGLLGLPGDITVACRQKFLQLYVMYEEKGIANYLEHHKHSIIANEYARILEKFGYKEYISRAIRL